MQKLSAVIIGLGGQSLGDHIPALLRREDVRIVGVCDPNPKAIERFKELFPELSQGVLITQDVVHLLDVARPRFAVVAVPHSYYYKIVVELCKRGVYFLKEKPLARNLDEAREMVSLPGFSQYAFITAQRRFSPLYQQAREAIKKIGSPYLFQATYKLNIKDPHVGWRGSKNDAGGGCLIDMGYHIVDQLVWWFGLPQKLHAHISTLAVENFEYDAEDSASVSFKYKNGLHGNLLISRAAGEKQEMYELYGSRGYMVGTKKSLRVFDKEGELLSETEYNKSDALTDNQLDFFISRVNSSQGFEDIQRQHMDDMIFIDRCYEDALQETENKLTREVEYV